MKRAKLQMAFGSFRNQEGYDNNGAFSIFSFSSFFLLTIMKIKKCAREGKRKRSFWVDERKLFFVLYPPMGSTLRHWHETLFFLSRALQFCSVLCARKKFLWLKRPAEDKFLLFLPLCTCQKLWPIFFRDKKKFCMPQPSTHFLGLERNLFYMCKTRVLCLGHHPRVRSRPWETRFFPFLFPKKKKKTHLSFFFFRSAEKKSSCQHLCTIFFLFISRRADLAISPHCSFSLCLFFFLRGLKIIMLF